MVTRCLISSISYNSKDFLVNFCNGLVKSNIIVFWCAIKHIGEHLEDGSKEKDHFHLFMEPHRAVDTTDLQKMSFEYDPEKPDKPLKCINFRTSKWEEWLIYDLHDPLYLMTKGMKREYTYSKDDFIYSDQDEFEIRYQEAMASGAIAKGLRIHKMMMDNYSVSELCRMGIIPPEKALHYKTYEMLMDMGHLEQMGRQNQIDRIKGEKERMKQLNNND